MITRLPRDEILETAFPEVISNLLGIILLAFGSGNVPQIGWPEAIEEASSQGIPIIIRSQSPQGEGNLARYVGGKLAQDAGALCARSMTLECTIVKTMFLIQHTQNLSAFRAAWRLNYAGEFG